MYKERNLEINILYYRKCPKSVKLMHYEDVSVSNILFHDIYMLNLCIQHLRMKSIREC